MRYLACALAALSALCVASGSAHAQSTNLATAKLSSSITTISGADRDYDFDLYVRSPVPTIKYFIIYTLSDGSTVEDGPISTYDMAAREIFFNFEHGLSPADTVDADIEAREMLDPFTKFARYDKYSQAWAIALQLESYGLETNIEWVRVPSLKFQAVNVRRIK